VILAPFTKQQNWQKCIYSSIGLHFANTFSATPTHHDFSISASCNLKLRKQKNTENYRFVMFLQQTINKFNMLLAERDVYS